MSIRVASYNIHDCVGRDQRFDPERIVSVLAELDADLFALQEVTLDTSGELIHRLETVTSAASIDGTLLERGIGRYGNLVLSRLPVTRSRLHDVCWSDREPRAVIDLNVTTAQNSIRICATHLGLSLRERTYQWGQIAKLMALSPEIDVLLGDINDWRGFRIPAIPGSRGYQQVALRSFPTWPLPLLSLDRIFVHPGHKVIRSWVHTSRLARIASDHFPVLAEIDIAQGQYSNASI